MGQTRTNAFCIKLKNCRIEERGHLSARNWHAIGVVWVGFLFALCFIVCVLLFCLRCAFLFALCFYVCVLYFFILHCAFLRAFSFSVWQFVRFCLRFLYVFDDVFFFVCVFFFCLCWPFWATVRNNIISCILISFTQQVEVFSFIVLSIVALLFIRL